MEWIDIGALYRYWREQPPVHELAALAVPFKRSTGVEADRSRRPDIGISAEELLRVFESGAAVPIGAR